ncbi:hypothetical protein TcCL_NonESM10246 [Trypanosoma cruzi]|nr:hypothetical protein TcCL_NonESM10246 [Trypanosoma cruzi]
MMTNASCPRILTNREARWRCALAVFRATDQSEITVPSGPIVKLLGVRAATSDQRLAVVHASWHAPLGTFLAPTLAAPTSLELPPSLSSCSWPKAGMSVIRRTTVERRWWISSFSLLVDRVKHFKRSDGAAPVRSVGAAVLRPHKRRAATLPFFDGRQRCE